MDHGSLAETAGINNEAKAEIRTKRVLDLLRVGICYIKSCSKKMSDDVNTLNTLATKQAAPK